MSTADGTFFDYVSSSTPSHRKYKYEPGSGGLCRDGMFTMAHAQKRRFRLYNDIVPSHDIIILQCPILIGPLENWKFGLSF